MLTMIEKRRTMLDTEKTCVEAAKSADELKTCRPERGLGGRQERSRLARGRQAWMVSSKGKSGEGVGQLVK